MIRARLLSVLVAFSATTAANAESKSPTSRSPVASFTLQDIHRRPRSLGDYKAKHAIVVVFLDTECPIANLYVPTLIEMHKRYANRGVQFLAINASRQDSFVRVSAHAQERDVPFPILKDFDHAVADAFGAHVVPEVFLLDAQRVIRYRGRIDDQYGVGGIRREKPTRRDLEQALDDLLAGRPITTPQTEVAGCPIERASTKRLERDVTFTRDIAPILQKRCLECHRPGEVGGFSLLTYEDALTRSKRIRRAVLEERMPPWHADPRYGKFLNDRRLSAEERDTLLVWIDRGAPKGIDQDLPPPVTFVDGWKVGKPDRIFTMAEQFTVPSAGVLPYKHFFIDPGLKEDVWIQSAECRPGNRAVVHHILVYILAPGRRDPYDRDGTAATLVGWAPGDMPAVYAPGTARRIPAGSKLMFEVHYTPNGTEQTDRSSVGVTFAKRPPKHVVDMNILANMAFRIPPGASRHKGEMTFTFKHDALILSLMPHMHLRGLSAKYVATYPDGRKETLLSTPDYDFNWQSVYRLAEPIRVPKGTKLTWSGVWDNSADNPRLPDQGHTKEVRWGLQTWEEMQNGWMEVVWLKK